MRNKRAAAWCLTFALFLQCACFSTGSVFAGSATTEAAHIGYASSADAVEKNYGKGNYLYDTVTFTGSGMDSDTVLSVKAIEDLACSDASVGYSGTYSFVKSGGEYYDNTMTGARLYELLLACGMDSGLADTTKITVVAKDGNEVELTLDELRHPEYYSYFTSKTATEASGGNLPVMLSFGADGVPLVGPTGDEAATKSFTAAEGYDSTADNAGGPIRLTIGQETADDTNARYNNKWVETVIVGDEESHSLHSGTAASTGTALSVNVYDSDTNTLLKTKTYTFGQIETFSATSPADNRSGNYYGSGTTYYEGAGIWKLLSGDVVLSGNEGQARFRFADGSSETVDLAYLRNGGGSYSDYVTPVTASDSHITCVKPIFACALNGAPLSGNNVIAALPTDGNYKTDLTLKACTGIDVYLGSSSDRHNAAPYSAYQEETLTLTGAGIDTPCELTVSELEGYIDLTYTNEYAPESITTTFRGIDLCGLLEEIGVAVDAENVVVTNASGASVTVSMAALTAASEITTIAYSKNGTALVPTSASEGYSATAGNDGGPLLLVGDPCYLEHIVSIEVTTSGADWSHQKSGYSSWLDTTLRIHGSEAERDVTITLETLENMTDAVVRDSFAAGGGEYNFEGIILREIIETYLDDSLSRPTSVSVVSADGYSQSVSISDLYDGIDSAYQPGEHRDVILAYSINGDPLVTTSGAVGYTGTNAFGPVRLVVENQISDWVKNVSEIVIGEEDGIEYIVNYYQTKARSSNDDSAVPGLGYTKKVFKYEGVSGTAITITPAAVDGWVCSEYEDADGTRRLVGDGAAMVLSGDASENVITLRYNRNAGFLICGNALANDYWYSYSDLLTMAETAENLTVLDPEYYKTGLYSVMKRGGVPANMFGSGLALDALLENIGGSGSATITLYAADGGSAQLPQSPFLFSTGAFSNAGYYYYPNLLLEAGSRNETGRQAVLPMLAFRINDISWEYSSVDDKGAPTSDATVTKIPTLAADVTPVQNRITAGTEDMTKWGPSAAYPYPMLMLGQSSLSNYNNTDFTKMIHGMIVGTDDSSLAITRNSNAVKTYSTITLLKNGLEDVGYSSNEPEGIAVDRLLGLAGCTVSSADTVTFYNGGTEVLSLQGSALGDVFVAPDADATTHVLDKDTPLDLLYQNGGTAYEAALTKINVVSSSDSSSGGSSGVSGGGSVVEEEKVSVPRVELVVSGTDSTETAADGEADSSSTLYTTESIDGVVSGSEAVSTVSLSSLSSLISRAKTEAAAAGDDIRSIIEIRQAVSDAEKENTQKTEVTLPLSGVSSILEDTEASLRITSAVAEITFGRAALSAIAGSAIGNELSVSAEKITASDNAEVNKLLQEGRPVFDFTVLSAAKRISEFGGSVSVSVPYTLAEGEKADGIVISYLADDGAVTRVEDVSYDPATGLATFTTTHFSVYAVDYDAALVWSNPFTDLSDQAWYYKAVKNACKEDLFSGMSASAFGPDVCMTRAMFVSVLARFGGAENTAAANNFSDVSAASWYRNSVAWAVENKIVSGIGNGNFGPEQSVSREQMAAFFYRYADYAGYDLTVSASSALNSFRDADSVSAWADKAMVWAVEKGLISGMGDSLLAPGSAATRAQVAVMMERFGDLFGSASAGTTASTGTTSEASVAEESSSSYEAVPDDEEYLTLKGDGLNKELYFTLEDLKDLKQYTIKYTGRNKENGNARQYLTFTGVNLVTLLNLAGWNGSGETMQVVCSDGYTKKYDLGEIMEGMVAFENNTDTEGHWVPVLIALVDNRGDYDAAEGTPFRLVYGQEPTDTDDTMSFNMQGWARYVESIEIF